MIKFSIDIDTVYYSKKVKSFLRKLSTCSFDLNSFPRNVVPWIVSIHSIFPILFRMTEPLLHDNVQRDAILFFFFFKENFYSFLSQWPATSFILLEAAAHPGLKLVMLRSLSNSSCNTKQKFLLARGNVNIEKC